MRQFPIGVTVDFVRHSLNFELVGCSQAEASEFPT
jgi:hypothetical protein